MGPLGHQGLRFVHRHQRKTINMRKTFIAAAAMCGLAGAASAQSQVTIYGSLDLAVTKGNGGTAPQSGGNGTSKAWIEKQSNASRLGFRGNEDIGGGLSAQFQLEARFTPDNGMPTPVFWHGRSYVQLSSAAVGRVYLGREFNPTVWPGAATDPFNFDGVAQNAVEMYAGFSSSPSSPFRTSNTVGYKSPILGGFTVNAAVSMGEGVDPRDTAANVEYNQGPIYAGLSYEKQMKGPTPSLDGNSFLNVGFRYDLGMVKPMLYYARTKTSGGTLTNKVYLLGAQAPIGAGTLKVSYLRLTPDSRFVTASNGIGPGNGVQTKFGLGYDYFLSKRTNVYADYGTARKAGTVGNVAGGTAFSNNTAYAFGLKHTF
jgi:predicted porin